MSNQDSSLSSASGPGVSGGTQAHLVKVLANVVETQKSVASQFTALLDRVEEARNETRRTVSALTDEIKKLDIRSNTMFEKVMTQLMAQNEALSSAHATERSQLIAQNESMLTLVKGTIFNVNRPAPVPSLPMQAYYQSPAPVQTQPMQAYYQALSANAMFGGAPIPVVAPQPATPKVEVKPVIPTPSTIPVIPAVTPAAPITVVVPQPAAPKIKVEVKPVIPTPPSTVPAIPAVTPAAPIPVVAPQPAAPKVEVKPVVPIPPPIVPAIPDVTPVAPQPAAAVPTVIPATEAAAPNTAWGDKFKMAGGEWECAACYVRNAADVAECSCCGSTNPNYEKKESDKPSNPFGKNATIFNPASTSTAKFSFGMGGGATSGAPPATSVTAITETKSATPSGSTFSFGGTPSAFSVAAPTVAPSTPKFSFMQAAAAATKEDQKKALFGLSAASSNAFGAGIAPTASPSASSFSFKPAVASTVPTAAASPVSSFSFMNPGGQSTAGFSSLAGKPSIFDQQDKVAEGQKNFSNLAKSKPFGFSPATPVPAPKEDDGEEEEPEEYEPDVEFAPVIPLPDLVEVKTGEEDETVLFTARSKIFRYVRETKEFKERGVGDIKLLHNVATNKFRVLMRREQVHKLCANFSVGKDLKMTEKQGQNNVRSIVVTDFAENSAGDVETLCMKFKNAEIAQDFQKAFEDAQAMLQ